MVLTESFFFFFLKKENAHTFLAKWTIDINLKPSMNKERSKQQKRNYRTNGVMGFIQLPIYTSFAQVKLHRFLALTKIAFVKTKLLHFDFCTANFAKVKTQVFTCQTTASSVGCPIAQTDTRLGKQSGIWSSALMQQESNCYHKEKLLGFAKGSNDAAVAKAFQQAGLLINLGEWCATELFHLGN